MAVVRDFKEVLVEVVNVAYLATLTQVVEVSE
jgi:hypothetical protein